MRQITSEDCDRLLADVAYLQDEMNALKPMISAVPARERPLGQDSIIDMIARIGHVQSRYYFPALKQCREKLNDRHSPYMGDSDGSGSEHIGSDNDINVFFSQEQTFDPAVYDDLSTEQIIDSISKGRNQLVEMLGSKPEKLFRQKVPLKHEKAGETREIPIYDMVSEMVLFERKQLKQVADRVLSIDLEKNTTGK